MSRVYSKVEIQIFWYQIVCQIATNLNNIAYIQINVYLMGTVDI